MFLLIFAEFKENLNFGLASIGTLCINARIDKMLQTRPIAADVERSVVCESV